MSTRIINPIFAEYALKCDYAGCPGTRKVLQAQSAGWRLGDIVQQYQADPDYGRCHLCRRYRLKVVGIPPEPPLETPQGFTKIPTE
jgi:hypothetical protein